jgi:hypothetical protein
MAVLANINTLGVIDRYFRTILVQISQFWQICNLEIQRQLKKMARIDIAIA